MQVTDSQGIEINAGDTLYRGVSVATMDMGLKFIIRNIDVNGLLSGAVWRFHYDVRKWLFSYEGTLDSDRARLAWMVERDSDVTFLILI